MANGVIPAGYTYRDGSGYFKDDDNSGPYVLTSQGTVALLASGPVSRAHVVSTAGTNATPVKASAGRVSGWSLYNTNAAARYVKLHNVAVTPTPGLGVNLTIGIPPNGSSNVSIEGGIAFSTGIGYSIVTGAADSDATAVAANDVVGDIYYS